MLKVQTGSESACEEEWQAALPGPRPNIAGLISGGTVAMA
jgi:hypothetical protein